MPTYTIYSDGDNSQLRDVIFKSTPKAVEQTKSIARQFQGKTELDTCRNIFNFLKSNIRYKEDGFHQKVKLPSALLRERTGDCKSYSVFTYAILTNLGIPCKYVLTSYNNDPTPSHIYVITDSGIIIDAVWGKFNSEKKATHKFYKRVNDMRISQIAGVKSPAIGCSSCQTTMGAVQGNANRWYDDNKQSLNLGTKQKAKNIANKLTYAPIRGLFRKFIENNGGGIATSIWRKAYTPNVVQKQIPQGALSDFKKSMQVYAQQNGVKLPTDSQRAEIDRLASVQVDASEISSGAVTFPNVQTTKRQSAMSPKDAWNKVLGSGQYTKFKSYESQYTKAYDTLRKKYQIPASTPKDIKNWKQFLKKWYELGGNPYELYESVQEGKDKSPRGKDANYMLMVSKTRGLKVKDVGLIIRGFVSAFGGERFNWGDKGTYMFGARNSGGIGDPITASTIATYIGIATSLFGLLSKIWTWVKAEIDLSKAKKEMVKLEEEGWVLEQDWLNIPTPRPQVLDVKQISVPNVDAPNLEDIGSVISDVSELTSSGKQDAYNSDNKAEWEAGQKEGAYSPLLDKTIEEAKTDKSTADYLALASKVQKAVPNTAGETIVRYVKVNVSQLDDSTPFTTAGFTGVLPVLLIGGAVIMALNKSKKKGLI